MLIVSRKLKYKFKTLAMDLRHGGFTGGLKNTHHERQGANHVTSTHISVLPYLLDPVLSQGDVFVDVGCGRGRVLNWVIEDGRAVRIFGLEIEKKIAASLCRRYRNHDHVTIVAGDALTSLPDAATLFYLWNPFKREVMIRFQEALLEKYARLGTLNDIRIVYHNCVDADLWHDCRQAEVTEIPPGGESHHKSILVRFGTRDLPASRLPGSA